MKNLIYFLFLFVSFAASAAEFQQVVGVIAAENKPVDIKSTTIDGNVVQRMVAIGQPVYLNDEINTGPDNKVQVLLKDKTAFNLGSNATIIVGKFVLNIEKPELSVDIKKGVFRFVSGKIADMKKDSMKVAVPNAVIGIRGTSVAGAINPDGSSTVVLIHGAIGIQGSQNSVEITKSGYGSQITSGGLINPPVAIPASTIKAITTSAQANAQSSQVFSDSSGNFANFNNYKMTSTDYQNLQQTAATRGGYEAAVEFFNLLGVDINAFDINYAYAKLDPALKVQLIALTKNGAFDFNIVKPFDTTLNLGDSYTYGKDDAYLASRIQALTLDQFKEPYPTINVGGTSQPIGLITFDVSPSNTPRAGYQLLLTSNPSIRANITQNVSVDFTRSGGSITNQYNISGIPASLGFNLPSGIVGTPAPITFAEFKNMANTNNIFYLPTDKVADGSQLFMTTALRLNNSSQLNLPNAQSSTEAAAWGLFGTYLISPTGQILFGSQQAIGNVSRK